MKNQIAEMIHSAIEAAYEGVQGIPSAEEILASIEIPPERAMGDYAYPCFKLAKVLRSAPPVIAKNVCEKIGSGDAKAVTAGGYLNFFLDRESFAKKTLGSVKSAGGAWGGSSVGSGKTICLDYSSINIAKRFSIGHLTTTVLGHSLSRIFRFLGYKTVSINHLGDWGTQFGKMLYAYKTWGSESEVAEKGVTELLRLYVKFHEEAEKNPSLDDEGRAWFKKIEEGDAEATRLFQWFKEL
ncbi:MAG: arginine--tRNA ligase, partial [Eubacteriales bacterium]|nr:arginine--tRNA ligase [Eubacteriales bacterium]